MTDTGCGMTEEVRARAWEPFFTTKPKGSGTGLGLATVYGVAQAHAGHAEIDTAPGGGTTVRVYFPTSDATSSMIERMAGGVGTPRGSETVLLVEDEDGVRGLTAVALRDAGYAVLSAASGEQAMEVARTHPGPIDVLVTDVVMHGLSGRDVADRLVAARPGVRVLYVSGYTDDAVIRRGVASDSVSFLQKPYTAAVLARKVRSVLDAPAAAGGARRPDPQPRSAVPAGPVLQ